MASTIEENIGKKNDLFEVPVDRGWAWVVLLGAMIKEWLLGGLVHMIFGVMYLEFVDYYSASPSATAWVGSLAIAITCIGAPIGANLAQRYSIRTLTYVSTILASSAFILTIFIPNVLYLYLTFGVMIGIADMLLLFPAMGLLREYFDRHLGLAIGFGYLGAGLGQMMGPPLFVYLLSEYGLKGTLLIWGGLQLNLAVCALLMRPTSFYSRKRVPKSLATGEAMNDRNIYIVSDDTTEEIVSDSAADTAVKSEELKLYKNPQFVLFCLSMFILCCGYLPINALIIPAHSDQVGLGITQVALVSTYTGLGGTLGRPLIGYLADQDCVPKVALFVAVCCSAALLAAVLPSLGADFTYICLVSGFLGFTTSTMVTLPPTLLSSMVSKENYTVACCWMGVFMGVSSLFNYALYAYLSDIQGNWHIPMYICTASFITGAAVIYISTKVTREEKQESNVVTTKL